MGEFSKTNPNVRKTYDVRDKREETPQTTEDIKTWFRDRGGKNTQHRILVYGQDNSGKTSVGIELVKSMLGDKDDMLIIIDLDDYGGVENTMAMFHPELAKNKNVLVMNPIVFTQDGIDRGKTRDEIKKACYLIDKLVRVHKKPVKAVLFDGISNLLKMAEQDMRDERNISPDGGVNQRYWQLRNEYFNEVVLSLHHLPMHVVYVAHEDFVPARGVGEEGLASVKASMNRRCDKKLLCYEESERGKDGKINVVRMFAEVQKAKFQPVLTGKRYHFFTHNIGSDKLEWEVDKLVAEVLREDGDEKNTH